VTGILYEFIYKQEQTSAKADTVRMRIRTTYNLMETSLHKDTSVIKFSWRRSEQFLQEIWAKLWENALSCNV